MSNLFMTIARKLNITIAGVLSGVAVVAIALSIRSERTYLLEQASAHISEAESQTLRILTIIDQLKMEQVRSSMAQLKESGLSIGTPFLGDEEVKVKEKSVPQLYLGYQPQANNFDLVDNLTKKMGGTATLFVLSGDEFVRVTTNVMTKNGRAIGTILAPQGAAIQKIKRNQAYYGDVDILGTPYITGYEPMHDKDGNVIGIWYVGYKADLELLTTYLEGSRIMQGGFVALIDDKGRIRSHSDNVPEPEVVTAINGNNDWEVREATFGNWDYKVVLAYPKSEISNALLAQSVEIITICIITLICLIALITFLLRHSVTRPLSEISQRLHAITKGDGDLTLRFNMRGEDELSKMAQGFDSLLGQLCDMLSAVKSMSASLTESCSALKESANKSHAEIANQSQRTERIVSAVTEISYSLNEVNQRINTVNESVSSTNELATDSSAQLKASVEAIRIQSKSLEESARVISDLNEASSGIGKVLEVIQNIAEQTNLLALNAAIEAARAGEQGRGFAVVADEVRSLASRTQESTGEINKMIERLQAGAEKAKATMDENSENAQKNVAQISSMFDVLEQIMSSVVNVGKLSNAILHEAQQQQIAIEQISEDMHEIADASNNVSSQSDITSEHSRNLSNIASDLSKRVSRYKTQ
ncbi:Cache 3/Cache 2 fusion domain-containing protein [Teredinibacter turnerae]|uniref:methyl-accepting chemotaxis protein n=1 Tax=Teredinibacter turnerae TaxID=2426 RepID=UPI001E3F0E55|nr:Cache 3/Cache 2 fusion domain-containing protein [Teredinibacter turnerae]